MSGVAVRDSKLVRILLGVSIGLPAAGLVVAITDALLVNLPDQFVDAVHVNSERSINTWWSVVQLAGAACVAIELGAMHRRRMPRIGSGLLLLAALLFTLSIDELMGAHEFVSFRMSTSGGQIGQLPWWSLWLFVGAPLFLAATYGLSRMLMEIASPVRRLLAVAAALYVTCAAGLELVSGLLDPLGLPPFVLEVEVFLEETGEAVAVSLTIAALLELRRILHKPEIDATWAG